MATNPNFITLILIPAGIIAFIMIRVISDIGSGKAPVIITSGDPDVMASPVMISKRLIGKLGNNYLKFGSMPLSIADFPNVNSEALKYVMTVMPGSSGFTYKNGTILPISAKSSELFAARAAYDVALKDGIFSITNSRTIEEFTNKNKIILYDMKYVRTIGRCNLVFLDDYDELEFMSLNCLPRRSFNLMLDVSGFIGKIRCSG